MTLSSLPRTLSRDVRAFAASGIDSNDCKKAPFLILKFAVQASQDYTYVTREHMLLTHVFLYITQLTFDGILPINKVQKAVIRIARFCKRIIINRGDVSFYYKDSSFNYSCYRLFMLPFCEKLRERWKKNPKDTLISVTEFLPSATKPQAVRFFVSDILVCLYMTFFEASFDSFSELDEESLFLSIKFSEAIGYEKGFKELQRVYCKRINNYKIALEKLVFAKINKLGVVEEFCRQYLNQIDTYIYNRNGTRLRVALTIQLAEGMTVPQYVNLTLLTKGYLHYNYPIVNSGIFIYITYLFQMNSAAWILSCEKVKIEDFEAQKKAVELSSLRKLAELPVEHLALGRDNPALSEDIGAGYCLLKEVKIVSISDFKSVPIEIIRRIGEVKDDLDCFNFSHVEFPKQVAEIDKVVNVLPKVNKLGFCYTQLNKAVLTAVLHKKQIVKIELSCAKFELPDDLTLFSHIIQLELINVSEVSSEQLKRLFAAARSVHSLCINNVKNYSFKDYPYPENLSEISAFPEIFYEDRMFLSKCVHLQKLVLFQMPSNIVEFTRYLPPQAVIEIRVIGTYK